MKTCLLSPVLRAFPRLRNDLFHSAGMLQGSRQWWRQNRDVAGSDTVPVGMLLLLRWMPPETEMFLKRKPKRPHLKCVTKIYQSSRVVANVQTVRDRSDQCQICSFSDSLSDCLFRIKWNKIQISLLQLFGCPAEALIGKVQLLQKPSLKLCGPLRSGIKHTKTIESLQLHTPPLRIACMHSMYTDMITIKPLCRTGCGSPNDPSPFCTESK